MVLYTKNFENKSEINQAQRPMMRPSALKGNDSIGPKALFMDRLTDRQGNMSTATATFGGRCARELF